MIEQASLIIGDGNWAVKSDSLLGYALPQGKYTPREMSVVRSTTGTRVNAAGLVELVPYNLVQYSEDFDNGVWVKTSVSVTANTTTAPNGTLTADKLTPSSSDSYVRYLSFNGTAGSVYTFSFYAKADAITNIRIRQFNATELNGTIEFITINNQWQRFTVTSTCAVNQQVQIWIGGGSTWSTGEDIFLWGAQLVEGSVAKDYLPTTDRLDIARIDYSTGEAALLVEPQRTNRLLNSENFSTYEKAFGAEITFDSGFANPSGANGTYFIYDTDGGSIARFRVPNSGYSLGDKISYSLFVKPTGAANLEIGGNYGGESATFNLITKTLVSQGAAVNSVKIEDYANGWTRYTVNTTFQNVVAGNAYPAFFTSAPLSNKIYIYGFQTEIGTYPTSYIPTLGTSVTRNADVIEKTGISDLIGQTEGTMFVDIELKAYDNLPKWIAFLGTGSAYIGIYTDSSSRFFAEITNAGIQFSNSTYTFSVGQRYKLAIAYKVNDFAFYINGTQVATDNSGTVPTTSQFGFQYNTIANNLTQRYYNSAALWKERLTNDQLATLTTI